MFLITFKSRNEEVEEVATNKISKITYIGVSTILRFENRIGDLQGDHPI